MSTIETQAVLSAQDLLRYEGEGGIEFAHGQLWEKPVSIASARVAARIIAVLGDGAEKSGGADVFGSSMGYRCFREEPLRFRKPDVSVVRRDRIKDLDPNESFMPIPPDLAVEVISPTIWPTTWTARWRSTWLTASA
ncbi:MAG: hypothetical protein AVDCRST_MAG91-2363 [uncultured Sphingomonadaceae bacterium]|uniref:Putative restriction endonuclease domain-containing protein n=1 Tax=uncultured Sphingomonadaceae bacterium TaxID=169976 RepID=A0A6J4TI25_9SPHN|nr:MAG: hypothetical protein AVDCRST_MAG91-2363 [uncultured Sphingomonadaceae bacterium]